MMKRGQWFFIFTGIVFLFIPACQTGITGELRPNLPPETHTVADTIKRSGEQRLNSEVHIRWWGDDPDGFVTGYEFSFDGSRWTRTASNDSVFLLSPPPGSDTVDFHFRVRAIDNEGLRDPSPAELIYPVKNSKPVASILPGVFEPAISYPAVKVSWKGSDPDGFDNISHFEYLWNDTTADPVVIDKFNTSATFVALDPRAPSSRFEVYLNNDETPQSFSEENILLNDTNRFYIRVVDNSGARSPYAASAPFFIKRVQSDILLVNAYASGFQAVESFYTQQLKAIGIDRMDTLRIFEQKAGEYVNRSPDNLTQGRVFGLFDYIVWFGSNAQESFSLAQKSTAGFFNRGGKMMMAMYISSSFDEQSQFLEFTPVQSLVNPEDTTIMLDINDTLMPMLPGYPPLASTAIVGVVKPIVPEIGSEIAYTAPLLARDKNGTLSPWTGIRNVMVMRRQQGVPNFFISSLELQKLNGLGNADELFRKVLIDEFGY